MLFAQLISFIFKLAFRFPLLLNLHRKLLLHLHHQLLSVVILGQDILHILMGAPVVR